MLLLVSTKLCARVDYVGRDHVPLLTRYDTMPPLATVLPWYLGTVELFATSGLFVLRTCQLRQGPSRKRRRSRLERHRRIGRVRQTPNSSQHHLLYASRRCTLMIDGPLLQQPRANPKQSWCIVSMTLPFRKLPQSDRSAFSWYPYPLMVTVFHLYVTLDGAGASARN